MELERLLRFAEERGARVTRKNGENCRLIIFGESHGKKGVVNPVDFFKKLKPKFFFVERVRSGEILDYEKFSLMKERLKDFKEDDETFYELVEGIITGPGLYAGSSINVLKEFERSKGTVFVGVDLKGHIKEDDRFLDRWGGLVDRLDDKAVDVLSFKSEKLSDLDYRRLDRLRDWLYRNKDIPDDAYEMMKRLQKLNSRFGDFLNRFKAEERVNKLIERIKGFDIRRERTFGETMARYFSESGKMRRYARNREMSLATVGAYHVREDSLVFPSLDRAGIEYVAIDIRKS